MGLLDVPKALISRLPLIGGSSEPEKEEPDEVEEETADEPDEPDVAEQPEASSARASIEAASACFFMGLSFFVIEKRPAGAGGSG